MCIYMLFLKKNVNTRMHAVASECKTIILAYSKQVKS